MIFIGPQAQDVLRPYLVRAHDAYCFDPRESAILETSHDTATTQRANAKCPRPSRRGDHYTKDSYRRAVDRACRRAEVKPWSPNQLRHSLATDIREKYGIEAAQNVLGHAKADVTQIYAERDRQQAAKIMREVG